MKKIITKIIATIAIICLLVSAFSGCGSSKSWVCDECGTSFTGTAYYGYSYDNTLCKSCAVSYWSPFPIDNYTK